MPRVTNKSTIVPIMSTKADLSNATTPSLFGATRRAVLALLFGHPEEAYYLRQIARSTSSGLGAVQRELRLLAAAGVIRRTVRGNQVYFQANERSPIFADLKGLVTKTMGAGDALRSALAPLASKIRVAFIFGSVARGDERPDSDIDVLLVATAGFDEVVSAFAKPQQSLSREINPTVYPPEEFRSKLGAGHHFLTSVFQQPKIFLVGDELDLKRLAPKRMAHRTPKQPRGNPKLARNSRS